MLLSAKGPAGCYQQSFTTSKRTRLIIGVADCIKAVIVTTNFLGLPPPTEANLLSNHGGLRDV